MEPMTIQEIAQAVNCPGVYEGIIHDISTDTRNLPEGCLFVALKGERFDGHDYIRQALENGAAWAIAQEPRDYGSNRVLYVEDTQKALMEIGQYYRSKFQIHCVGITGSVGKTTTKDMIAQVVSAGFKTLKTQGNLNNEIGLPKTLLNLDASYEAAVIEMGMEGLGEIAALSAVCQPEIGVITNIGVSHIQRLGSRENILKAKLELADALPDGAPLFLCGDNDLLSQVRQPRLRVQFYGIENPACGIRGKNLKAQNGWTVFTIEAQGEAIEARIPCLGSHNVLNALAAFGVGRELGIPAKECAAALEGYVPSGMRQRQVKFNGCTVIEDCYNASPDSMEAALATLEKFPCSGKRIAVLGDMLELGPIAHEAHTQTGVFAATHGVDLLLAVGELGADYVAGANALRPIGTHFSSKQTLLERLKQVISPGDVIWVKASRGMRMEEILQGLYKGD